MPDQQRLILLTGMSGAGKTTAVKALEDAGFYCIDNLPSFLLPALLADARDRPQLTRLGLVMDARDQGFADAGAALIESLKQDGRQVSVIFLEASDETLLRRYSEMRRRHPFASPSLRAGIQGERLRLAAIRALADLVIDTTRLTPHGLRSEMLRDAQGLPQTLQVGLISFGFKHGPPQEADLILDVRFLPNPYFVPGLRPLTGLDEAVAAFVLNTDPAREFLNRLLPLLRFLIPQYRREGKSYLTIGIGCTGGQHRSVAVAERLRQALKEETDNLFVSHRDLG
ncbi:MAG: RNase adapter RapZ [Desulfobacteraceae bacterium]|nr:RNase adapter RapZ [Desulfobacteraceae bacterium]